MPLAHAEDRTLTRGIAYMIAAQLLFTAMDSTMKLLSGGFGPAQIIWGFFLAFAAVATLDAWRTGAGRALRSTRRPVLHLGRALLLPANMACMVVALGLLPIATVTAVVSTFPLIVTALSVPVLGETVGPRRWVAVAAGFLGVMIIVRPGTDVFDPAALVPLAAGTLYALYQVLTRLLSRTDRPDTIALTTAWVGLAVCSLAVPFDWRTPTVNEAGLLALVAFCGTAGHRLVIAALALVPASVIQPFTYLQIIWATIAGIVVFATVPDSVTIVGASIIAGSGLYVWWRERAPAPTGADL